MRYALLYGAELQNMDGFHADIAKKLAFPDWYGHNFDALYDCLTDICEDTTLIFFDASAFAEKAGQKGRILLRVLADAEEENSHFTFRSL